MRPTLPRRHDRGAGGEGIRQRDEAKGRRAPDHDLLGQPRQVDHAERGGRQELHDVIAIRHGIERVGHRRVEAQRLGGLLAVDRVRRAGERGGAERRLVHALAAVPEARTVAADHLDIGQQVMAEGDGLRRLQVGEARHDGAGIFLRAVDQRRLQIAQHGFEAIDLVAHPQPHVECHLVVARARGVQAPARWADQLGEPRLDVEMDVLELGRELELAALDLGTDLLEALLDGAAVGWRQDALGNQHVGMRQRARDVLGVELAVETDGGVDLLHDFRRPELVAAAPHGVGVGFACSRPCVLPCHE